MEAGKNIINIRGASWKHRLLEKIAHSKEFPTRLRLFNLFYNLWGLDILKAATPSGLKLAFDISDWVQAQIYFQGNYEKQSLALFKKLSLDARVIFDIGAHIGQYALECAIDDKELARQIFAIEVNPKTFTFLLNNIQLNGFTNITPILGAAAADRGVLHIDIPAYWNLGNTQVSTIPLNGKNGSYVAVAFSIEDILKKYNLNNIDLIKIDVEGYEFDILKSLFTIKTYPSNILFEYIPGAFDRSIETIKLLHQNGYIIKNIDGSPFNEEGQLIEFNLWACKNNQSETNG